MFYSPVTLYYHVTWYLSIKACYPSLQFQLYKIYFFSYNNFTMSKSLKNSFKKILNVSLNHNQSQEIERLFFEIKKQGNITNMSLLDLLVKNSNIKNSQGKDKFFHITNLLINLRFPITSAQQKIITSFASVCR